MYPCGTRQRVHTRDSITADWVTFREFVFNSRSLFFYPPLFFFHCVPLELLPPGHFFIFPPPCPPTFIHPSTVLPPLHIYTSIVAVWAVWSRARTSTRLCGLCQAFGLELAFNDSRTRRISTTHIIHQNTHDDKVHNANVTMCKPKVLLTKKKYNND